MQSAQTEEAVKEADKSRKKMATRLQEAQAEGQPSIRFAE